MRQNEVGSVPQLEGLMQVPKDVSSLPHVYTLRGSDCTGCDAATVNGRCTLSSLPHTEGFRLGAMHLT